MKNLHAVVEPPATFPDLVREVNGAWYARTLAPWQNRFVEEIFREPAVFHRLNQLIERLFYLGLREGEVALPVTREERVVLDDYARERWRVYPLDDRWTYRGWPLAIVP